MFKASKIEHSYTTIGAAAHKDINAVSAKSHVENFFIVGYQLCFCCKCWYIPYGAGGVDARGDNQARG